MGLFKVKKGEETTKLLKSSIRMYKAKNCPTNFNKLDKSELMKIVEKHKIPVWEKRKTQAEKDDDKKKRQDKAKEKAKMKAMAKEKLMKENKKIKAEFIKAEKALKRARKARSA